MNDPLKLTGSMLAILSFAANPLSTWAANECTKSMVATFPCNGVDTLCGINCWGNPGGIYNHFTGAAIDVVGFDPGSLKTAGTRSIFCTSSCGCATVVQTNSKCVANVGCVFQNPFFGGGCSTGVLCVPIKSNVDSTLFQSCVQG